jgi:hypothetical protein
LQSLVSLNIHNECQDINLISPVYFIHGGKWHVVPGQEIDVGTVMSNHIEPNFRQDMLEGALVYNIQRKYSESSQDKSNHVWLLVAWEGKYTRGSHVCALVVEYNKELDEDKLRRLYQKRWPLLKERANNTGGNWTLNDKTVLTITIKTTNRGYRWDIFVSEERK